MPGGINPSGEEIASWPTANHVDPETRGWGLLVVTVVLTVLALATVTARLWARVGLQRNAGLDDALIVAALVPALGLSVSVCLASKVYMQDRHVWDVPFTVFPYSRKMTLVSEFFYLLSTSLTRLSILCFYRRIAKGSFSTPFLWCIYLTIGYAVAYLVTFEVLLIFGCSPISAYWRQVDLPFRYANPSYTWKCIDEGAALVSASVVSLSQDLLTCVLPILYFWNLRLPRRQKLALMAVFSVGGFLCITAVLRIYYIHQIFYETYDTTWVANDSWLWTVIETLLGIVCASAPALKLLATQFFRDVSDAYASSTGGSHVHTIGSQRALKLDDLESDNGRASRADDGPGYGSSGGGQKPHYNSHVSETSLG